MKICKKKVKYQNHHIILCLKIQNIYLYRLDQHFDYIYICDIQINPWKIFYWWIAQQIWISERNIFCHLPLFTICNSLLLCFMVVKIFVIMSFRFGHQITCNIKRNVSVKLNLYIISILVVLKLLFICFLYWYTNIYSLTVLQLLTIYK